MERTITIHLVEVRSKQADAEWSTLIAYDNREGAISLIKDNKRCDLHRGEAAEWEYHIRKVRLITVN